MALTLLGYPSHVGVEGHRDGVRIIGLTADCPSELSVTAAVWDALSVAGVATVGLLIVLGIGGPFLLSALGVDSLTAGTSGRITHLFAFTNTPTDTSVSVGPCVAVVGAFLGLAFAFVRSQGRQ